MICIDGQTVFCPFVDCIRLGEGLGTDGNGPPTVAVSVVITALSLSSVGGVNGVQTKLMNAFVEFAVG